MLPRICDIIIELPLHDGQVGHLVAIHVAGGSRPLCGGTSDLYLAFLSISSCLFALSFICPFNKYF